MEHHELQHLKITWHAESVSHSGFVSNMCNGALHMLVKKIMAEVIASNENDYDHHLEATLVAHAVHA